MTTGRLKLLLMPYVLYQSSRGFEGAL